MIRTALISLAALASLPAFAHDREGDERRERHGREGYAERDFERARWERQRAFERLHEAREEFYQRWDGNPWARTRFERWYAWRLHQLREW